VCEASAAYQCHGYCGKDSGVRKRIVHACGMVLMIVNMSKYQIKQRVP
jgi:hypothetical protein